jgi:hypothetical protein
MQFTFCTQAILLSAVTQVIFVWVLFHVMQNDDDAACQMSQELLFLVWCEPLDPMTISHGFCPPIRPLIGCKECEDNSRRTHVLNL